MRTISLAVLNRSSCRHSSRQFEIERRKITKLARKHLTSNRRTQDLTRMLHLKWQLSVISRKELTIVCHYQTWMSRNQWNPANLSHQRTWMSVNQWNPANLSHQRTWMSRNQWNTANLFHQRSWMSRNQWIPAILCQHQTWMSGNQWRLTHQTKLFLLKVLPQEKLFVKYPMLIQNLSKRFPGVKNCPPNPALRRATTPVCHQPDLPASTLLMCHNL